MIIKTTTQIEKIAASSAVLAEVLHVVCRAVEPGISTYDLNAIAYKEIVHLGGRPSFLGYKGFPASICTSVDQVVIHGIPTRTPLTAGQIVGIDCGVCYEGHWSDAARSVTVGTARKEYSDLIKYTVEALYAGIAAAHPPNTINDISRAISAVADRHKYGVVREYCGHGVGLAVHEEPSVPNYVVPQARSPRLTEGMVLAIEPMFTLGRPEVYVAGDNWSVVTKDGLAAAHCEHTVLVAEHPRILTK